MSVAIASLSRTILVFVAVLFLVVLGWRLFSAQKTSQPAISFANFVRMTEQDQLRSVTIYMGYDVAELQGVLDKTNEKVKSEISVKELPLFIKKMLDKGTNIEFARARRFEPAEMVLDLAPVAFIAIIVVVFLVFRKWGA